MIAGLDDILRRILGMQKPPPDDAQPFVAAPAPIPSMGEGEMAPMTENDLFLQKLRRGQGILPLYVPGNNLADDAGPGVIPNSTPQTEYKRDPAVLLRRGNAKSGSGIDI